MRQLNSVKYAPVYLVWGVLFFATAVLGLVYPAAEGVLKAVLQVLSVLFFLPPCLILVKAKAEGSAKHRAIIRNLSLASLIGTLVMLVVNLRSVGYLAATGKVLHIILTIISAPMICSSVYALSLFLWAALLMGSFGKSK